MDYCNVIYTAKKIKGKHSNSKPITFLEHQSFDLEISHGQATGGKERQAQEQSPT